ncbi:hypothetical protein NXS08_01730 [Gleimia sp. 6138-11-ORH1]|uniref:hypothetical protein n=1 Tax=Gleimia sp. 6138-11-ORH1 TaxID=2973937 RepID=UPI002167B914|nr:hypothetical protein [Gleimia sp. 6138-11-ORH1]MCS4484212.1 hypothetical protein [Gleimia sp. 6138-11-ORH1]
MAELKLSSKELSRPVAQSEAGERYHIADRGLLKIFAGEVEQLCDWFEVQQAIWVAESKRLLIRWVDPARPALRVNLTEPDQTDFMRLFDEKVTLTIVLSMRRQASNGTNIMGAVRRRPDGELFSVIVVDGPLEETGEQLARELEKTLRDAVGLDE